MTEETKERKRFIYVRIATGIAFHQRCSDAEEICPGAMGLYLFLNAISRHAESRGETRETVARASWGAANPSMLKYRQKQADALIVAGLLVREGSDLVVVKYLEHNDGPEEIAANRAAANKRRREADDRKKNKLTPSLTRESRVSDASVSISCSSSYSQESRSPEPDPARAAPEERPSRPHNDAPPCATPTSLVDIADAMAPPPDWWLAVCETVSASCLGRTDALAPAECWLAYAGHRNGKGRRPNRNDACTWLTTVMVPRTRAAIRQAAEARDREAGYAAERAARQPTAPMMPYKLVTGAPATEPTPEELAEVKRLAAKGLTFLDDQRTGTDE